MAEKAAEWTPERVLALEIEDQDSGAKTVRDFLKALLGELWFKEEGFSGKRPFGNSGWKRNVEVALVKAGAVKGAIFTYEEDGSIELESIDHKAADALILKAIAAL